MNWIVIQNPKTPEEFRHNWRIFDATADYLTQRGFAAIAEGARRYAAYARPPELFENL